MTPEIIRVERGREVAPGVFEYAVRSAGLRGKSHQPLLDACRQLKALYGSTARPVGLFREGQDTPDLTCRLDVGASLTVSEPSKGRISFVRYREFPSRQAAA